MSDDGTGQTPAPPQVPPRPPLPPWATGSPPQPPQPWSAPPGPWAGPAASPFAAPYQVAPRGTFADAPVRRSRAVGAVALTVAVLAAATAVVAAVAAFQIGLGVGPQFRSPTTTTDLAFLTPVRDWVLMGEVAFWVGTALGVWALAQGIVAAATGRGRGPGIGAIALAAIGPVIFFAAVTVAVSAGLSAAGSVGG